MECFPRNKAGTGQHLIPRNDFLWWDLRCREAFEERNLEEGILPCVLTHSTQVASPTSPTCGSHPLASLSSHPSSVYSVTCQPLLPFQPLQVVPCSSGGICPRLLSHPSPSFWSQLKHPISEEMSPDGPALIPSLHDAYYTKKSLLLVYLLISYL